MIVRDQRSEEWTKQHTLTEEELKQLILNKFDRAVEKVLACSRKREGAYEYL
jgi:hypothetical protein